MYNKDKHDLCRPQCVLGSELLAAKNLKLLKCAKLACHVYAVHGDNNTFQCFI